MSALGGDTGPLNAIQLRPWNVNPGEQLQVQGDSFPKWHPSTTLK